MTQYRPGDLQLTGSTFGDVIYVAVPEDVALYERLLFCMCFAGLHSTGQSTELHDQLTSSGHTDRR